MRAAPRARVSAWLVARRIRADGGSVWGAMLEYGIGYDAACRIRAGWRGAGRRAEPIAYRSRGYSGGYKSGRSPAALAAMRA
jgi:hypothetical protein